MNELPLVSVLMTAYNREKFIAESIESVLSSTYINFELIIVDDCSMDNTVKIAKSYEEKDYRIKVFVNEQNLGDYYNRNKAAKYAKGKYIKYLDSDDLIYPHSLAIYVEGMEKYPNALLGVSSLEHQAYPFQLTPYEAYYKHFVLGRPFLSNGPSSVIIRRDAFEKSGGFSGLRFAGDYEMWLKLVRLGPVAILPICLIWWRSHDEQEYQFGNSLNSENYYKVYLNALLNENCPLKFEEKKIAIKKIKIKYLRILLGIAIKQLSPKIALNFAKKINIVPSDIRYLLCNNKK